MPVIVKKNNYHYQVIYHHASHDHENETTTKIKRNFEDESSKRAKRMIIDLSLNNNWTHFLTITLDRKKIDRYNAKHIKRRLQLSLNKYKTRHDPLMQYVIQSEYHKDGAIHFHGLIYLSNHQFLKYNPFQTYKERIKKDNINIKVYNFEYFAERFGRTWVQPLYNQAEFVAYYLSKYINKSEDRIYYVRYFRSRGLKESETLYNAETMMMPYTYLEKHEGTFTTTYKLDDHQYELFLQHNNNNGLQMGYKGI